MLFDQAWRGRWVRMGFLSLCAWVFGLNFVTAYWRSYEATKIAAVVAFVILVILTARAYWLVVSRERAEVAGKN